MTHFGKPPCPHACLPFKSSEKLSTKITKFIVKNISHVQWRGTSELQRLNFRRWRPSQHSKYVNDQGVRPLGDPACCLSVPVSVSVCHNSRMKRPTKRMLCITDGPVFRSKGERSRSQGRHCLRVPRTNHRTPPHASLRAVYQKDVT